MTNWLFSCMRNEAPYVLEWVAYHRLIGFGRMVIFTNNCDDNTVALLDALAGLGWLERRDNPTPQGVSPQIHAASRIGQDPPWADGDWVMWLDTDEFLNIHAGAGHLDDLLTRFGDADGYGVHWRLFGDGGQTHWQNRPVIERFTQAARARVDLHEPVKTLFRWSRSVECLHAHRPVLRPSFREQGRRWLHGPGVAVPEVFYFHRYNKDSSPALRLPWTTGQFAWAQVNHYAVRTRPEYAAKSARGSGIFNARHTQEYWALYNQNARTDETILRHRDALAALMAEAMTDHRVAEAQTAAIAAYGDLMARTRGAVPHPSGGDGAP